MDRMTSTSSPQSMMADGSRKTDVVVATRWASLCEPHRSYSCCLLYDMSGACNSIWRANISPGRTLYSVNSLFVPLLALEALRTELKMQSIWNCNWDAVCYALLRVIHVTIKSCQFHKIYENLCHMLEHAALFWNGFEEMRHPPHSPDLVPSDYHLFPNLKKYLHVLSTDDEL